jgi:SSS family solute:Na+ symporter
MGELSNAWFPGGSGLTPADFATFVALLAAMTALGRRAAAATATADDYFLAGRREHWLAAGLALVAAEVSTLTLLGVPAASFREDWSFLQFFLGAAAARVLVALVFLPAFFRDGGETPYAYLGRRFGPLTRTAGALTFLVTRVLVSAVRLLAACVAAGFLLGWSTGPTLILFTLVSIAALARGGARAAIWTGAFQALAILGVGALSVAFLLYRVDGGVGGAWSLAGEAGKLRLFSGPSGLGIALATGFFGSAAAFGTDHEMTQKLLAVKDARLGRRAMFLSIAGSLAVLGLYLTAGTLLFVFYKQYPGMALPDRADLLYPHFAAKMMGPAMRGLVLGALVLASIDAPLASLSTAFVVDLRRPFVRRERSSAEELRLARAAALVFALLLAALALVFAYSGEALSLAFKAAGVAAGPLLGVFLLGLTTSRRGDRPAASAFGVMTALDLALLILSERGLLPLGWSGLVALGAVGSFGLGWALTSDRARRLAAPLRAR